MTTTGEDTRPLPLIGQAVGQAQASLTRLLTGILAGSGTSYLLWLGLQSFERQRQAVQTLTREKLDADIESDARTAAAEAFHLPPRGTRGRCWWSRGVLSSGTAAPAVSPGAVSADSIGYDPARAHDLRRG